MYEKSELMVSEYDKNRISFVLAAGKLYITETMVKDIRISFYTKNAYIYATGTIYSVEYDKSSNETTVKTFKGTVHIETIPQQEVIDLKAGEEIIITNEQILCNQSEGLTGEKEWKITTVYYNPYTKEPVIGFDVFQEYITATTEHSVICFTREENQWEDSIKDAIISPPTIFNERVYITTKDTLFCYNLYSGIREKNINLIEKMGVGKRLVKYNHNLYLVFPSGIYLFDSINQAIQRKPFIYVIDTTLPVFSNDQVYVTSYITRNAEAYDHTGELLWSISLNDRSPYSPVLIGDSLCIATKKSTLYKITLSGEIEKQKQVEGTIESIIPGDEQFFYVNTKRNRLFKIDKQMLNNAGFYDNIETAFSHNNMLFLGKRDGIIKIIARNTEKEIVLRNSFVTAFTNHETDYYAGCNNGYIMRISKE